MKHVRLQLLVLVTVSFGAIVSAPGQPGYLDPSFGGTGLVQIGFGGTSDNGQACGVQSDGQLLLAGTHYAYGSQQIVVLRLGTNNLPDPTFGDGGLAAVTPASSPQSVVAVAQQSDGRILVAGTASGFMLFRLNTDGSLDTSFGDNGFVTWSYSGAGYSSDCTGMALQGDGKIVLVGTSSIDNGIQYDFYLTLLRVNTDGTFDSSFGSAGVYLGPNDTTGDAVVLRGDGDILVGGNREVSGYPYGTSVLAFTTNGAPDTAFGSSGVTLIPTVNSINVLAIQPGGLVVGQNEMILAGGGAGTNLLVARMSTGGTLDSSFGGAGYITKGVSTTTSTTLEGMACFVSGNPFQHIVKIVVAGSLDNGNEFVAARFNSNGSSDTNFGFGGLVLTPIPGSSYANAYGFATPPGYLVLSGSLSPNSGCQDGFLAVRYDYSNGALDTNFYGSGILLTNLGNLNAQANSVAVQSDGKIVLDGSCDSACIPGVLALCRLNADASLDYSFGIGGKIITSFGSQSSTPMVIQPDGRIVVAGVATTGSYSSVMVARFLTNGMLDPAFGSGGVVTNQVGTNVSSPNSIVLQSDGKILVGASCNVSGNDIAILRLLTNGLLDTHWGVSGVATEVIGTSDTMASLAVQSNGKVVDGGYSYLSSSVEFSLLRCNTNGALDNTFGSFGRAADPISGQLASAGYAMVLQPDGKILLAGATANSSTEQVALMRFNSNGSLDTTFGNNGASIASIGLGACAAYSVCLQPDGKIVTGCLAVIGPLDKFAAARFLTNGVLDATYGVGGVNYYDFGTGANENVIAGALDPIQRLVLAGTAGNLFAVARVSGDPLLRFNSITAVTNHQIYLAGLGVPGVSQTLLKTTNPRAAYSPLSSIFPDASGNWEYLDTNAPASAVGGYRLSYP